MKITFIRNTHDENGIYRGEKYFGKINHSRELPFGVHVWGYSGEALSLDEIYARLKQMYKEAAHNGISMDMPEDERHSIPSIMRQLTYMIEKKIVLVSVN